MPQFPLIGPSYTSQSVNADCQTTMNLYPEAIESGAGNNQIVLYPSPGTKTFVDISPPEGGLQNILIDISAAQLRASGIAPIQLLPAPGANLVIIPLSANVQYNFVSKPYNNINGEIFPNIGLGNTVADVQNSFVLPLSTNSFRDAFSTMQQVTALSSFNNLPPSSFVNLPLLWADQFDPSASTGDGTATVNVQYYVLNVVTGKIVGGTGKVHITTTQISANQFKNSTATPVTVIPATGPNQVIVPLSMVVWHHFHTTPFTHIGFPIVGYGAAHNDSVFSRIFQTVDSNSFLFVADSMEQQAAEFYPLTAIDITPAKVINQPLTWTNTTDISADPGDTTATVYMMYLVIDVTTGQFIQGIGTMFSQLVALTAAQVRGAFAGGVPIVAAPGVNQLIVEQYSVAQVNFNSTAYAGGNQPAPRIAPAANAVNAVNRGLLRLSTTGGGITLWTSNSTQMLLEGTTFYAPPNSAPGNQVNPSDVINQPAMWGDFNDTHAGSGDSTVTFILQYMVLDTNLGILA